MRRNGVVIFAASLATWPVSQAMPADARQDDVRTIVTQVVRPLMRQYGIPGLAVGITVRGRHYVLDYGVASKTTGKPVAGGTLFEIGSLTKTFTATLVSYAQLTDKLSLSDEAGADLPSLRGTSFDRIRLVNLGTYTAGSLPLQFPDAVVTDEDALRYYRRWKPSHPAGTYRLYSNPSIMLLGSIAANTMHANFTTLLEREVFAPLGLRNTFLAIPGNLSSRYAQGYTDAGLPRRVSLGPLAAEAYGIRTTASDLLQFVDANMNHVRPSDRLRRAIVETHTGYYRAGAMTQDLIWEQYDYPVSLAALLQGNSPATIFDERKVRALAPPSRPSGDVWLNKTGSTSGFGAYVAFVPRKTIGIVLLANRAYPIAARVTAAYRILTRLAPK